MISDIALESGDADIDASALFSQIVIDKAQLSRHIRHALQDRAQITLGELVTRQPLRHGLAELVAYLQLGSDSFKTVVDEAAHETIAWTGADPEGLPTPRQARLPRVIFVR